MSAQVVTCYRQSMYDSDWKRAQIRASHHFFFLQSASSRTSNFNLGLSVRIPIYSLATDSSPGGRPPQQLDIARSFDNTRASPSGTSSTCSSQPPSTTPYSLSDNLAPTSLPHHLQPSHSFSSLPTRNPEIPILPVRPTSTQSHRSSTSPGPCSSLPSHAACATRRGPPIWVGAPLEDAHTTSTTRHAAIPGPTVPSLSASIPATPPPTPPRPSYLRIQPTQMAPMPMCACPLDGRSAARRWPSVLR